MAETMRLFKETLHTGKIEPCDYSFNKLCEIARFNGSMTWEEVRRALLNNQSVYTEFSRYFSTEA